MSKVRVQLHKNPGSAVVENGATVGATLGVDFYSEDGKVLTLASLRSALDIPPPVTGLQKSSWKILLDIPPNVVALEKATGTGFFTVTGDKTGALRTFSGPMSVDITFPDGIGGAPVFALDGDDPAPGNDYFYGTSQTGTKQYNVFGSGGLARLPGATYRSLQDFVNVMHSPGLIEGGDFLSASAGDLVVDGGTMMIRVLDDNVSALVFADFPGATVSIPADSLARFIGVEYNGGSPQIVVKTTNTWDQDTEFPLGTCANNGSVMFPFYNPFKVGDPITNIIQRFDAQSSLIRDSAVGGMILANVATRTATLSAGVAWARLNDYPITAKNSSVQTMVSVRPGPGGTVQLTNSLTQWPNTQYTDPTGTLVTMGNNKWAVLWFFVNVGTNAWGFAYGTAEYNNAATASQETIPSYLSAAFLANNILVGRMLFEKNEDTPIVESAFTRVFNGAALADHNQLTNLQGGQIAEYYHLTAAQHSKLAQIANLADPGADSLIFWNDTTGLHEYTVMSASAKLLLADATVPRLGTANTWSLTQTFSLAPIVSAGAVNALFVLDGNAGTARRVVARTGGINRWQWGADGSDNYILASYDDAGTLLGQAYTVDRLTRVVTFNTYLQGRKPWAFVTAATGSNTPNLDNLDATIRTALAGTFTANNPSGTKRNGAPYTFRLRDNGTARAINWGSEYRAMGVALPTTTVANKTLRIMFEANADENTMDLVSVTQQL